MSKTNKKLKLILRAACLFGLLLGFFAGDGRAQTVEKSVMQDYRGVKIGMTAADVIDKLGKAKVSDDDGFLYVFSDEESAQIGLDGDKKVSVISIDYGGDFKNPPTANDVFGKDIEIQAKEDGSVYKMIRYPDDGYWLAYNRLAGDKAMVSITLNKIR